MCIWARQRAPLLTKDREQHIAILIFVKIFQSVLQFFSLTLTIAINRNLWNDKSGKSPMEPQIFPKIWEPIPANFADSSSCKC